MKEITQFTHSLSFIISFLVMLAFLGIFIDNKTMFWFLLLVLSSMLILNYEKFAELLQKYGG